MSHDNWDGLRDRVLSGKEDDVLIFRDTETGKQYVIGEYHALMAGAGKAFQKHRDELLQKAISMIHEEFVKAIDAEVGEEATRKVMLHLLKTLDDTEEPQKNENEERLIPYDQPRTPRSGLFDILENLGQTDPPEAC